MQQYWNAEKKSNGCLFNRLSSSLFVPREIAATNTISIRIKESSLFKSNGYYDRIKFAKK